MCSADRGPVGWVAAAARRLKREAAPMGSLRRGCRPRLVCPHLAGSEVPPTDLGDANHGAEPVRIGELPFGGTLPARHCVRSDRRRPGANTARDLALRDQKLRLSPAADGATATSTIARTDSAVIGIVSIPASTSSANRAPPARVSLPARSCRPCPGIRLFGGAGSEVPACPHARRRQPADAARILPRGAAQARAAPLPHARSGPPACERGPIPCSRV